MNLRTVPGATIVYGTAATAWEPFNCMTDTANLSIASTRKTLDVNTENTIMETIK